MEAMREKWTDERLDDLNRHVCDGFNRIDQDLRALRSEMRSEIGGLRSEMKAEIGALRPDMQAEIGALRAEMNARFDSLQRTILQVGGGAIATFLIGFAGLLVTRV